MESQENDIYTGVAFSLVSVVGVIGNIITLLILRKDNNFRAMNNARLPIGNLAVVDLFLSLKATSHGIGIIDKKITADTIICKITAHLDTVVIPMTYLSHALVALHRWKTLQSLGSRNIKGARFLSKWHSIAVTWLICLILSSILNIPQVMGPIEYKLNAGTCKGTGTSYHRLMAFNILTCTIVVLTSYIQIYRLVRSQNRQIRDQIETTDSNQRVLKQRALKITKMLFIIFTAMIICTVPHIIIVNLREKVHISVLLQRIVFLVVTSNNANNFFIYGLMDPEYRTQVKNLFKCK